MSAASIRTIETPTRRAGLSAIFVSAWFAVLGCGGSAGSSSSAAQDGKKAPDAPANPDPEIVATPSNDTSGEAAASTGGSTPTDTAEKECETEPGLSKMLQAARGRGLPRERSCVWRPPSFPGLILVGDFAYDRGCRVSDYVRDCELLEKAPTAQEILLAVGWSSADAPTRVLLARAYLEEITMHWGEDFLLEPEPPAWSSDPDGGVTGELWVTKTSGRSPRTSATKIKAHFDADGKYTRTQLGAGNTKKE